MCHAAWNGDLLTTSVAFGIFRSVCSLPRGFHALQIWVRLFQQQGIDRFSQRRDRVTGLSECIAIMANLHQDRKNTYVLIVATILDKDRLAQPGGLFVDARFQSPGKTQVLPVPGFDIEAIAVSDQQHDRGHLFAVPAGDSLLLRQKLGQTESLVSRDKAISQPSGILCKKGRNENIDQSRYHLECNGANGHRLLPYGAKRNMDSMHDSGCGLAGAHSLFQLLCQNNQTMLTYTA